LAGIHFLGRGVDLGFKVTQGSFELVTLVKDPDGFDGVERDMD
jgi:hypothetical protein